VHANILCDTMEQTRIARKLPLNEVLPLASPGLPKPLPGVLEELFTAGPKLFVHRPAFQPGSEGTMHKPKPCFHKCRHLGWNGLITPEVVETGPKLTHVPPVVIGTMLTAQLLP
jgi:hypothetical protein